MGISSNMGKKTRLDEYYNNGIVEYARKENVSITKNVMTKEENDRFLESLGIKYDELKNKIDAHVDSIRKKVSICNPIHLMQFAESMYFMSAIGITSEVQLDGDSIPLARMAEYVQSVLVSSQNQYVEKDEDQTDIYNDILKELEDIYTLEPMFYMAWTKKLGKEHPGWDDSIIMNALEAILNYNVRGNRYQFCEHEYYGCLLKVHNDVFVDNFGITSADILDGIMKLENSLTQGYMDSINDLGAIINANDSVEDVFYENHKEELDAICGKMVGTDRNDVQLVTKWPKAFIEKLSYCLDEVDDFFDEKKEFSGWPFMELPIQKKPFICIEGNYYCFDYYSFIDNFYRAIQKMITSVAPEYNWAVRQSEASEIMVEDVFRNLLPGCASYRNNYYPMHESLKHMAENDLVFQYEDILLIVEVKAASFVYTSPLVDFESQMESYHNLIEKADHQCNRTFRYIEDHESPDFYNEDKSEKFKLNKKEIRDIFQISVTVDNINAVAAKAEKMSFLQLKSNAISISVDDLVVYSNYFNSALVFLHFLKQRRLATSVDSLALNDELDHLGLYIDKNCYTFQMEDISDKDLVLFVGYREELDKYFGQLYHPQLKPKKPLQKMPDLLVRIVSYLEKSDVKEKAWLSSYLLDFSFDAREMLCNGIEDINKKHSSRLGTVPVLLGGGKDSVRTLCFVNQIGADQMSDEDKREYVLSTMLWNDEQDRVMLDTYFDEKGTLKKVDGREYHRSDVLDEEVDALRNKGAQKAAMRIEKYKSTNHKKIGRNDMCPCGSGKKYKYCCGR